MKDKYFTILQVWLSGLDFLGCIYGIFTGNWL